VPTDNDWCDVQSQKAANRLDDKTSELQGEGENLGDSVKSFLSNITGGAN
jgi:hypothetical protein